RPSCAGVSVSPSPAARSTHGARAHVPVSPLTSSCTNASPLYEFWMLPAGSTTWVIVRGYSTSASYDWNTTGAPAGTERFGVWIRDAASTAPYDTFIGIAYTLS